MEGLTQKNVLEIESLTRKNGKKYSMKNDKNRFFFPSEYMKFEEALKPKQRFASRVEINTGARYNELKNIKVEDIDFEGRKIVLRVTKSKAIKGEKKGRGRVRIIPISSQFSKYLKKELRGKKTDDYIGMLSNSALNIAFKKAAKKVGIKNPGDFSSHSLRKTLECWLMSLGVRDSVLLAHFGHDLKTAASHYISPDIFSHEEKMKMRIIIGDLYSR